MKKSIFNASFEESLNLEDDGFRKLQQEQHDKIEKYFKNGKPSLWFRIYSFILGSVFAIDLNFMLLAISFTLHDDANNLTLAITKNSFLTANVFLIGLFIWLLLVVLGKFIKQNSILPYRYNFHIFTNMIWFIVELDLLFMDFLVPAISFWGVAAICIGFLTIFIWLTMTEKHHLKYLLYHKNNEVLLRDKISKTIAIYGMSLLGVALLVKHIFFAGSVDITNSMKAFGFFITWIVINIAAIATIILIGIPYFLQAYYKWKYPEEYREWEGKSLEEWYGKKYLKKHKELLEHE
ncbi:hypothetical protein SAMN04487837_0066 [Streptococcus equinus]|uniref:hypothetical protein n=1 Tax=Streptococcus equinus TaxID=1335 RepID=UPI00087EAB1C|nr:hypothetical protein [Streptococcus equinus]SDQ02832.1 hypothetical protein SAMN04487837_0066 [Streptococcus equinus]